MSFDGHKLFDTLPAILRIRDLSQAVFTPGWLEAADRADYIELQTLIDAGSPLTPLQQRRYDELKRSAMAGPLANLLAVLGEQLALVQEDLDQLYDDQFVETCAPWVASYIGDLIGYRSLRGVTPKIASPRAEVAHTIGYRRRKGTVVVLEQLARDVTGWKAAAVEYFQRLVMTQYMNHRRLQCLAAPDLRRWEPLERLGGAFDTIMHTVEVRRIASRRGRFNIPNVGLFLWRIDAWPLSGSPAVAVDARRWRFHPLGIDQPLYTHPATIADFARLSTPLDVPEPISRRVLDAHLPDYYAEGDDADKSLRLYESSSGSFQPVPADRIRVCNLEDQGTGWAHLPTDDKFVVDPVLGRIALPPGLPAATAIRADFHYGFSGELGGGEYDRSATIADAEPPPKLLKVPDDFALVQDALDNLGSVGGVVLITDSGRYAETLSIAAPAGKKVELRADNHCRPTLILAGLTLEGGSASAIRLSGLLIGGTALQVPANGANRLAKLDVSHCTLVPGWTLNPHCQPQHADEASLVVEIGGLAVTIERSTCGGLRIHAASTVAATDSIIDATETTRVAYAAAQGIGAGGALWLEACTVIGKINALTLPLVSNAILLAQLGAEDDWPAPVLATRRQEGCVRFSYLPDEARVPRRYRCLPESAASPALAIPRFTSLRYGVPSYGQLAITSGAELLVGADNEGQPGAFNFLFQPQREANLRARLDEYLRIGLAAGIFYAS